MSVLGVRADAFPTVDGAETLLRNLQRVNFFIGPNNSGKSRMLRSLANSETQTFVPMGMTLEEINNAILITRAQLDKVFSDTGINDTANLMNHIKGMKKIDTLNTQESQYTCYMNAINILESTFKTNGMIEGKQGNRYKDVDIGNRLRQILKDKAHVEGVPLQDILKDQGWNKIFVPQLRGLRSLTPGLNAADSYTAITKKDYFGNSYSRLQIYTGQEFYQKVEDLLLGDRQHRKLVEAYELFLSNHLFSGAQVEIIPKKTDKHIHIRLGMEKERPVSDLGDGLQSVIMLTFPFFTGMEEGGFAFIEEPELFLHPGLQRQLLECWLSAPEFNKWQFFVTTHSNHFLDTAIEMEGVSIYSVQKQLKNLDEEDQTPVFNVYPLSRGESTALKLLGVRVSSVFLSNCTVWVEGITDRLYLRKYLQLLNDELTTRGHTTFEINEDVNFSFVEYGGNNVTHWSVLTGKEDSINVDRLCAKLCLIADRDKEKEKRHAGIQAKLGDRFYLLDRREIENLLTEDVLRKVINEYEGVAKDTKTLTSLKYGQYGRVLLGGYIEKLFEKEGQHKRKGSYQDSSGTVSDKVNFCWKALKYIDSWNGMSADAKQLAIKVCNFVLKQNGKEILSDELAAHLIRPVTATRN